jgi:TolB protein
MRTTQMTRDTNRWECDRHPSWSPDCKQIVFYSNRTGKNQIWVMDFWGMNFDGSNQYPISDGNYSDWDPVWIK